MAIDHTLLQQQADAAIAQGADPVAVRARMASMGVTPTTTAAPSTTSTPSATVISQHLIPLAQRAGERPRATDYRTPDGRIDNAAYRAAVHAWMYGSGGAATPPGSTGSGAGTGTGSGAHAGSASAGSTFNPTFNPTALITKTPGYQFQLKQGLDAINSNAYLRGTANSGATAKALNDWAQQFAQGYYQQYLDNVNRVAAGGASAAGALNGAAQNMGNGVTNALNNQAQAYQNQANSAANNAYNRANASGSMASGIASGLGQIGSAIGSSYQPTGSSYPMGPAISDRRLKTNIRKVGEADDGLGIYDWNWKDNPNGQTVRGVIADEVAVLRPWAFIPNFHGEFAGVDYSKLGGL